MPGSPSVGLLRKFPAAFLLVFVGAWGFLLAHLGREWWSNPQYGYGLFVPALCLWLLWQRRAEIAGAFEAGLSPRQGGFGHAGGTLPRTHLWVGRSLLLMGALALLPIELLRQVSPHLRAIGMLGTLFCFALTWWTLRHLGLRHLPGVLAGAAFLFLTSVPWPTTLEAQVTQALMRKVAALSADFLNVAGILAIQRGNLIELNSGVVSVSEACSGVRSLQSCLMVSVALGQFFRLRWSRAGALIGLGFLLAMAGNMLRTLLLTWIAARWGPARIESFHDPAGLAILLGVTAVLYASAGRFWKLPEPAPAPLPSIDWSRLPRARAICMVGVASILAAHLWFWSHDATWPVRTEPSLAVNTGSGLQLREIQVPQEILDVLQPHRGAYYQAYSPKWGGMGVYTFFWLAGSDQQAAFFHRPDVCMTGAGWEMIGESRQMNVAVGGRQTRWYVFTFRQDGQRVIQAWGVWRDGVEQKLDFTRGWSAMFGQHLQRWHYILEGRRKANTEIVSVILDARLADEEALKQVIPELFQTSSIP